MQHLLLLHGALGAKHQFQPLLPLLEACYQVHTMNFSGHGGAAMATDDFSIPLFAKEVLAFLDQQKIPSAKIFGYSMGGYVAIYLAKMCPDRIQSVVTLATKFAWTPEISAKELTLLDATTLLQKVPAFVRQLQDRHAPNDWRLLLEKTKKMLMQLGQNNALKPKDYPQVRQRCLLLVGDHDKMVPVMETMAIANALPLGEYRILQGTPHPVEQVNLPVLAKVLIGFYH